MPSLTRSLTVTLTPTLQTDDMDRYQAMLAQAEAGMTYEEVRYNGEGVLSAAGRV